MLVVIALHAISSLVITCGVDSTDDILGVEADTQFKGVHSCSDLIHCTQQIEREASNTERYEENQIDIEVELDQTAKSYSPQVTLLQTDIAYTKRDAHHLTGSALAYASRVLALAHVKPSTHTAPPVSVPAEEDKPKKDFAEIVGVNRNKEGDSYSFLIMMLVNIAFIGICLLLFERARRNFPVLYENNVKLNPSLAPVPPTTLGWISASLNLSVYDVIENTTLDHGMSIEFLNLCTKILFITGMPMCFVLLCAHIIYRVQVQSPLDLLGMNNLPRGSSLYWLYCVLVWYVVAVTQWLIHQSQAEFHKRRIRWLAEKPVLQATTTLVEFIPEDKRSVVPLTRFLAGNMQLEVQAVVFVKDTTELLNAMDDLEDATRRYNEAVNAKTSAIPEGQSDQMHQQLLEQKQSAQKQVTLLRDKINQSDDYNSSCAFATFKSRRDAEVALKIFTPDGDEDMVASLAPEPADVIWRDLIVTPCWRHVGVAIGIGLIVLLFFSVMPLVVGITSIASVRFMASQFTTVKQFVERYPQSVAWDGVVGVYALSLVMSMLPAVLWRISSHCFCNQAHAFQNLRVQNWYFYFLLAFVLLITTLGTSAWNTSKQIAENPEHAWLLLAEQLPSTTHFYLNFLPLQWSSHALMLTRYGNFFLYRAMRRIFGEEEARTRAEPEDQDYHGIGSRSARFTLALVVTLVFSTITPLIIVLGLINFAFSRIVYAYLYVYAESKKADSGGRFWNQQLNNVQLGLLLYIILMVGLLFDSGPQWCWNCTALSVILLYITHRKIDRDFHWESLSLEEAAAYDRQDGKKRTLKAQSYKQPELCPEEDEKKQQAVEMGRARESGHAKQLAGSAVKAETVTNGPKKSRRPSKSVCC